MKADNKKSLGLESALMKKKQLEIILSQLAPSPKPRLRWEGYALDAESAAQMTYTAGWANNDIIGKDVVDLGCGSGTLAIAASLLGAGWVVGVDIDREAVGVARVNAGSAGASVDLVTGDIECVEGHFDTTLMNPPFGSWRRGADVRFLKKALEISDIVYSLHKRSGSVRDFLRRRIPQIGGQIDRTYQMEIVVSRTYSFHKKRRYPVKVDLYRILKARSSSNFQGCSLVVQPHNNKNIVSDGSHILRVVQLFLRKSWVSALAPSKPISTLLIPALASFSLLEKS